MEPFQIAGRPGWYIRWKDPNRPKGRQWVTRKGGETQGEAWVAKRDAEENARLIARGLITERDLKAAEHARRPIAEELADWRASMENERRSPGHIEAYLRMVDAILQGKLPPIRLEEERRETVERTRGRKGYPKGRHTRVRKVVVSRPSPVRLGYPPMRTLADIDANSVDRFLGALGRPPHDLGAATRNKYLQAIKALCNWAIDRQRLRGESPLDCLHMLNVRKDPRKPRRALTVEQFDGLLAAARAMGCDGRWGRGAAWYVAFYLVQGRCGARATEAARLRWEHVRFDDGPAGAIDFAADITKTGEAGRVDMIREVATALQALRPAGARPKELVFGGQPARRTLVRHLKAAGVAYEDEAGRVVSLRKTLASQLIAAGIRPRELQIIMRHRDIKTTFGHYSDPNLVDTRSALQMLSRVSDDQAAQHGVGAVDTELTRSA